MVRLDGSVTIKQAAQIFGAFNQYNRKLAQGRQDSVNRDPVNNRRRFKKADLERLLQQTEPSGGRPTGWPRAAKRNGKLR